MPSSELIAGTMNRLDELRKIRENKDKYDMKFIIEIGNLESLVSIMFFVLHIDCDPHNPAQEDVVYADMKNIGWHDVGYYFDLDQSGSNKGQDLEDWRTQIVSKNKDEITSVHQLLIDELRLFIVDYANAIDWNPEKVIIHIPTKIYPLKFLFQNVPDLKNLCNMPDKWRINFGINLIKCLNLFLEETSYIVFGIKD